MDSWFTCRVIQISFFFLSWKNLCGLCHHREIMLFIGKPKGRSRMISNHSHHPPLSKSGNVSGHHLAGSNETGCWSSFVSFVASFSSVQFCHPCHLFSYWLSLPFVLIAGCVLESGPETQLYFRVHLPPLAGSSTNVHSSMILQNAPPCYVCSSLSARQVASV